MGGVQFWKVIMKFQIFLYIFQLCVCVCVCVYDWRAEGKEVVNSCISCLCVYYSSCSYLYCTYVPMHCDGGGGGNDGHNVYYTDTDYNVCH